MKTEILTWAGFTAAVVAALSTQAQGTFQNLDFEQADPVPIVGSSLYPYAVTAASALPGWTCSIGGVTTTQVLQNDYSTGAASIDILGPNWNTANPGLIDGNYTVFLQAGPANNGSGAFNASISEDGTVPANAEWLELKAWSYLPNAPFSVSFDGNILSPSAFSTGQSSSGQAYTLYGFDIAPYAGQTGPLQLTSIFSTAGPSGTEFDDISFSPIGVTPEPDPLVLTAIGGLLFALYRRFAPKRQ